MGVGEGSGEGQGKGSGEGRGEGCSEGCVHCARVTLIVFNTIFLLAGLAALGLGIWMVVDPNILQVLQVAGGLGQGRGVVRIVAYLLLATGGAIFLVSLFGLIGASRWNKCLLATYIALCVILMAAQIAVFVLGFLSQRYVQDSLKGEMEEFVTNRYDNTDNLLSNGYRRMQANLKCCGVSNGSDWVNLNTLWYRTNGSASGWNWPRSCCDLENNRDPSSPPRNELQCRLGNPQFYNSRGCFDELYFFLRRFSYGIGGGVVGLFVLQLLVVTFAGIVHRALVDEHEYGMNGVKPMVV